MAVLEISFDPGPFSLFRLYGKKCETLLCLPHFIKEKGKNNIREKCGKEDSAGSDFYNF